MISLHSKSGFSIFSSTIPVISLFLKGTTTLSPVCNKVIYKYPGVDAVAVIGIPSIEQGEIIAAYIQAKENETIGRCF